MKKLTISSKAGIGRGVHRHVLYLNDEDNTVGLCGTAKNHIHEIEFIPGTDDQEDPNTGEVIQGTPARFKMLAAADGHTHVIEDDYPVDYKVEEEQDEVVVSEVLTLYRQAAEGESESFKKAIESDKYYAGIQWSETDKTHLDKLDRACLTINLIAPKIDDISGEQRQTRTDPKLEPIEDGDQRLCDLYNIVIKTELERNRYDREKSKFFLDQVITGRGNFNVFLDRSKNPFGDARIEHYPYDRVKYGPHEKEDLSDLEYLFKDRMFSKAKLMQLWPDKADDIKKDFDNFEVSWKNKTVYADDNYKHSDGPTILIGTDVMIDIAKKEFRVIECWRRTYIESNLAVNEDEDFATNLFGWSKSDQDQIETIPGFFVFPRNVSMIRITKVAGGMLLSDENPADVPTEDFHIVPGYAYKRGDIWWGKVEAAKDPQREINKRRSQSIDIVNRMQAHGWGFDEGTFADKREEDNFKKNSTKPGFTVKLNDVGKPPYKFQGSDFPEGLVQLLEMDMRNLDLILSISPREPGANTSAAAILQAQKSKLIGNEFLFDNLSFAEKKAVVLLIAIIAKFYTPERIYRIVNNQNAKKKVTIGGHPFEHFSKEEIIEILETSDITKTDVAISDIAYSPTVRLAISMMIQSMIQNGAQIPPELAFEYSDLPEEEKQKIRSSIAQQQQASAQAEQATSEGEILKTLIGQGLVPPEIMQRYFPEGLPGQESTEVAAQETAPDPSQEFTTQGISQP